MSLLSLEKFLYASGPAAKARPAGNYLDLSTRVLSAIRRSVFSGEIFSDLSEELETIRKILHIECDESTVSANAARVEYLLETFQARTREANQQTANDFKNVLNILNETFTHLHTGTEKSDARLKELETGLSRAAKVDDLPTLRLQLSKMLEFVRQEGKRDQEETLATMEVVGHQMRQANAVASRFRTQLPGRVEAIQYLTSELEDSKAAADLHVALFSADSLRVLRTRHGEEIASNILEELGRKHIPPLEPAGKVFCWSPTSILLVWHHTDNSRAAGDLPNGLKLPVEHRAFVGTRVATFQLAIRSLVMQVSGTLDEIVWSLDRFWKAGSAC